jgi:hypothetical protein
MKNILISVAVFSLGLTAFIYNWVNGNIKSYDVQFTCILVFAFFLLAIFAEVDRYIKLKKQK